MMKTNKMALARLAKFSNKPYITIDRKRMDDALASKSFDVPQGLSVEEIQQHIIATAKSNARAFDMAFPDSVSPPPDPTVADCMAEIMRLNVLVDDLRKSITTPAGWKLVPMIPTPEMAKAGGAVCHRDDDFEMDDEPYRERGQAIHAYMEMLEAAPKLKDVR